jgi:dipeptidyl aminopeptidase/acylaminoacyl peptidase
MLRRILSDPDLELRLFVNDREPSDGDVSALYETPGAPGYSPKRLDPKSWRFSSKGDRVVAEYPEQSWTFGEPTGPVHGYFVVSGDRLMWAERFARPADIAGPGHRIVLPLRLELAL